MTQCEHEYVITGIPSTGVWAYCCRCGMRTPEYPWYNGAWAQDLFARAIEEGTLYEDKSLIRRCLSTHGTAGYTIGDYWDGDAIVCIICGKRIENPRPTSYRTIYYRFRENPIKWLLRREKAQEPMWPEWIRGTRGIRRL